MRAALRRACHYKGVSLETGHAVVYWDRLRQRWALYGVRNDVAEARALCQRMGLGFTVIEVKPLLDNGEVVEVPGA